MDDIEDYEELVIDSEAKANDIVNAYTVDESKMKDADLVFSIASALRNFYRKGQLLDVQKQQTGEDDD